MRKFKERFKPASAQEQSKSESPRSSSPSSQPNLAFPDGIKLLYDCADATIDIVFVHGLTGNRESTWTAAGHSQPWPAAFLGPKLSTARILAYGYDAYVIRKSVASSNRLIDHSTNLLNDLVAYRASNDDVSSTRPIVFVAHSLGGLVCKEAILLSRNNPDKHLKDVFDHTKGIIFMGTPHTGSWMADWAKLPASGLGIIKSTNKSLLKVLETDDQFLESLQIGFLSLIRDLREDNRRFEVTCFFEELPMPVVGKIVSKDSATFAGYNPISVHANHSQMVKFASAEETGFTRVFGELARWEKEVRDQATYDSSVRIRPLARKAVFSVPFEPDAHLVPRDELSSAIKSRLDDNHKAVLYGMGGTGKSQIAIAFAHEYRKQHPESHVFWIFAATSSRFVQACQRMAQKLHLPGCDNPEVDACQLVANWLEDEENAHWLLIVDNADDANLMLGLNPSDGSNSNTETQAKALLDYLPRNLDSSRQILVTTRNRDVASGFIGNGVPTYVGPFSRAEARLLLQRKVAQQENWPSEEITDKLLEELAFVPLAITQAAAFMNRNSMTITRYLDVFLTSEPDRMRQLDIDLQDDRRERGFPNSIFRTWRLSFDQIERLDPIAANFLALWAFLEGQSIPLTLLQHTNTLEADWRQALGTVAGYSLVAVSAAGETISMHPLVQTSVRWWVDQQRKRRCYVEQAVQLMADSFPLASTDDWTACQTLLPHALVVLQHQGSASTPDRCRGDLTYRVGYFYQQSGCYDEALRYAQESHDVRFGLRDCADILVLESLGMVGWLLWLQGKVEEAEELHQHLLTKATQSLGKDHPFTLEVVHHLALLLSAWGKYEEAEEMYRQCLKKKEIILGDNHPSTLRTMSNLGWILGEREKFGAEEMIRQCLERQSEVLGEDHPEALVSLGNLGQLLSDRGKYAEAEHVSRRILNGRRKVLGDDHPDAIIGLNNLGTILRHKGMLKQARDCVERALIRLRQVVGEVHPYTLLTIENLGAVLALQRDYKQAEVMLQSVLHVREGLLGEDHPDTLASVSFLGWAFHLQGKYEQAAQMYRRELNGLEKVLGGEHSKTLLAASWLACMVQEANPDEAAQLHERAALGMIETLGPSHPTTIECQERRDDFLSRLDQQSAIQTSSSVSQVVLESQNDAANVKQEDAAKLMNE